MLIHRPLYWKDDRMHAVNGLKYKVDQVELKLDEHRQESKDGFAGLHRLIGGISTTLTDHEERIRAFEGD